MAHLTIANNGALVWTGSRAEANDRSEHLFGWIETTQAPAGKVRFYTGDYSGNFLYNPWAGLPMAADADQKALERLAPLLTRYQASFRLTSDFDPPMPKGETLLPFQRAGVEYAMKGEHVLFGDPMGLGKSIQAMAFCNCLEARRILILCPASVVLQWRKYARRWLLPLGRTPVTVFAIMGANYGVHPTARVVICSFDRARGPLGARLLEHEWDAVVMDECHYLRNHDARRTVGVLGAYGRHAVEKPGIISRAKRLIAATGTYLPNRPKEGYTIGRALDWESLGFLSQDAFETRFNSVKQTIVRVPGEQIKAYTTEKIGRLSELNARFRAGFMVRRNKIDALPQLPPLSCSIIPVGNKSLSEIVKAEQLLDIDPEQIEAIPPDKQGHVAALRRQMGLAMAPLVVEYVANMLESQEEEAVLLFAYHRDVIALLEEKLASFNPVIVMGGKSITARQAASEAFANDRNVRLFIGQLQSAGTGVDGLQTRASRAVFAEPSWVPGDNLQCVDRLWRIGQESPVQADFLVADGSWNQTVLARAISKLRTTSAVLDRNLLVA